MPEWIKQSPFHIVLELGSVAHGLNLSNQKNSEGLERKLTERQLSDSIRRPVVVCSLLPKGKSWCVSGAVGVCWRPISLGFKSYGVWWRRSRPRSLVDSLETASHSRFP